MAIQVPHILTPAAKEQAARRQKAVDLANKALAARFSQAYANRQELAADSVVFRSRVSAVFKSVRYAVADLRFDSISESEFAQFFEEKTGWTVPCFVSMGVHYKFDDYFKEISILRFLDVFTLVWVKLVASQLDDVADRWLAEIRGILIEEGMSYELDDLCCARKKFDPEFNANSSQAIEALKSADFKKSLVAFEQSISDLARVPPRARSAVREAFEAIEGLVKTVCPPGSVTRLEEKFIKGPLRTAISRAYQTDTTALVAMDRALAGLCDWVTAAHQYRHADDARADRAPAFACCTDRQPSGLLSSLDR